MSLSSLDTDAWYNGGIDRGPREVEQDEPDFYDVVEISQEEAMTILDAETRANMGAATATAPDFSGGGL